MFIGTYQYRMDDKGRITFPTAFRTVLREQYGEDLLVLTRFDHCLNLFPKRVMFELQDRLKNFHTMHKNVIPFLRNMFYWAHQCQPDRQGRILVPTRLREYAGIREEAVLIGIMEHIEIWDPATMDRYLEEGRSDFDQISAAFSDLLFSSPPAP